MGALSLAPFPHHSWLGYWEHVPADKPLVVIHRRQVAHCLMYLPAGQISLRSFHRGHQTDHMVNGGSVSFSPADGHRRTLVGEHNLAHDYFTLIIPRRAVGSLGESEGVIWTFDDLNCFFSLDDAVLRWCILASIPPLQANSDSLTGIALDLGFSSQSHFTRLFSEMSGMTPAKYRKQFRRTVGWRVPSVRTATFAHRPRLQR
jgi:AraC-like DNA-binding protein